MPSFLLRHFASLLTLSLVLIGTGTARATSSEIVLDSNFGSQGKTLKNFGGRTEAPHGVTFQKNGKMVVVGESKTDSERGSDFALIRLKADGAKDVSFGNKGVVFTNLSDSNAAAFHVAIQGDDKIVVVGSASVPNTATLSGPASTRIAIVRYLPNGEVDQQFGDQGRLFVQLSRYDRPTAVAFVEDRHGARLLVGAEVNFFGAKFRSALIEVDLDFGLRRLGRQQFRVVREFEDGIVVSQIRTLPDGQIYLGLTTYNQSRSPLRTFVRKFDSEGGLDAGFGNQGEAQVVLPADTVGAIQDFQICDSGDLIFALNLFLARGHYSETRYGLASLTSRGAMNKSFGAAGVLMGKMPNAGATSVFLSADQEIALFGMASPSEGDEVGTPRLVLALYSKHGKLVTAHLTGDDETWIPMAASQSPDSGILGVSYRVPFDDEVRPKTFQCQKYLLRKN